MKASRAVALAGLVALLTATTACSKVTTVERLEEPVLVLVGHPPALPPVPEPPPPEPPPPPPKLELTPSSIELFEPIVFLDGSPDLDEDASLPVLEELRNLLDDEPRLRLLSLEVHSGPDGSKRLSKKRAKLLRDYLASEGIDAGRFKVKGWGKSRPLPPEDGDGKPVATERVEIIILQQDPAAEPAAAAASEKQEGA